MVEIKFDALVIGKLFAQFYYRDINTPEYCRYYTRAKHAFLSRSEKCV